MTDQRFERRQVLKGAAAFGALGALATVQGPPIARADAMTGIEGTWLSTVTVGNSFTCTATVGGQTKHVQVTVKTTDGVYEVAEPN